MTTLNDNYFKERILPHFLCILGFIVILVVYFYPAFFEGKGLLQNDILQGLAAGHEATEYRLRTGMEALWTNSMFSGMPLYLINLYFSGEWFTRFIMDVSRVFPKPADTVFLNFICFYILLSILRVRPWIAFMGAFVYAFGTFNIISIEAGHIWKVRAIGFMPLVFAGFFLAFKRKWLLALAITAIGLSLELGAQHYQITYYLLLLSIIFMLNELYYYYKEKQLPIFLKAVAILFIAAILAVGSSLGRLWMVTEYGQYSTRGKSELTTNKKEGSSGLDRDYTFAWSQGKMETLTLLVPDLFGGASNVDLGENSETYKTLQRQGVPLSNAQQFTKNAPAYWGDQPFTSGPVYTGIIVIFLFVLGMFILKPKEKWWALIAVIFSFFLAWGKNFEVFNYIMFDYFPAYNKFRAVSMALVIALFCFPLIGTITLNRVADQPKDSSILKNLWKAATIVVGLLVCVFLFSSVPDYAGQVDKQLPVWLLDALKADRKSMLVKDTFRSLFFVVALISLLYFYLKARISSFLLLGGVTLLAIVDLYSVDKRYLNDSKFTSETVRNYFEPTEIDKEILKDTTLSYRVFNTKGAFSEARTSYFHKSIGGYNGAKLGRYQELIDYHLSKGNMKVFDMLNTKYFIVPDSKNPVQQNPNALGNAWFIKRLVPVASPTEEIQALSDFNPAAEAFIDTSKFSINVFDYDSLGVIKLTEYEPNYLKYTASSENGGFAVFSEIYYPKGWQAFIDGEKTPYVRVNYVLRGLKVPSGKHVIEFKFKPAAYNIGNKVMWISSALMAFLLLAGLFFAGKNRLLQSRKNQ